VSADPLAEPYRGKYKHAFSHAMIRMPRLLREWHSVYCALTDEVKERRGHPNPEQASDKDRFEVLGPGGARFSVESTQSHYQFYVHDGSAWEQISDLEECITRLSDLQKGPQVHVAALANLRLARELMHTSIMQLRDCPTEDPHWVGAQAWHEMHAIADMLQREMEANTRRERMDYDSDEDGDDFVPSSPSESDTSYDSLDSGDAFVVQGGAE